jgi:hypothetical protein
MENGKWAEKNRRHLVINRQIREPGVAGGVQEVEDARNLTSLRAPRRPPQGNLREPVRQKLSTRGVLSGISKGNLLG